jgi:hypothetical protein
VNRSADAPAARQAGDAERLALLLMRARSDHRFARRNRQERYRVYKRQLDALNVDAAAYDRAISVLVSVFRI